MHSPVLTSAYAIGSPQGTTLSACGLVQENRDSVFNEIFNLMSIYLQKTCIHVGCVDETVI